METAVNKLETLFQKGIADLDYIQHRLEFEIRKSLPENPSAEENPFAVLEELAAVKARYKKLWLQLEEISREERESIKGICAALEGTMKTVKALQQLANLKCLPLSEEQMAAQQLTCQTIKEMESLEKKPPCSGSTVPASTKEQH